MDSIINNITNHILQYVIAAAIPFIMHWLKSYLNALIKKHKAEWLKHIAQDIINEIATDINEEIGYDEFIDLAAKKLSEIGHIKYDTARRIIIAILAELDGDDNDGKEHAGFVK